MPEKTSASPEKEEVYAEDTELIPSGIATLDTAELYAAVSVPVLTLFPYWSRGLKVIV